MGIPFFTYNQDLTGSFRLRRQDDGATLDLTGSFALLRMTEKQEIPARFRMTEQDQDDV